MLWHPFVAEEYCILKRFIEENKEIPMVTSLAA
jgi:hypothetical protein